MLSLVLLFGGLGGSIWVLVTDMQNEHAWHFGGIATFVQNMLILLASFIFRLSRRSGDHSI